MSCRSPRTWDELTEAERLIVMEDARRARIVMIESRRHKPKCPNCNGRGVVGGTTMQANDLEWACSVCKGTGLLGKFRLTQSQHGWSLTVPGHDISFNLGHGHERWLLAVEYINNFPKLLRSAS